VRHIVTSRDGFQLVTESDERTVPFDRALASTSLAADLVAQGDFTIVTSLDDLPVAGEEFIWEAPRIASPAERRAAFRVIKGGKL